MDCGRFRAGQSGQSPLGPAFQEAPCQHQSFSFQAENHCREPSACPKSEKGGRVKEEEETPLARCIACLPSPV